MGTVAEKTNISLSLVIPLFNEEKNVRELYARLVDELSRIGRPYEIVFVDDGSTDSTPKLLEGIAKGDRNVVALELARNYGQTAALAAGFDYAHGDVIVSMDGDLQHDPSDLPRFVGKIDEGYDIVSGWRKRRVDNFLVRRLPSLIANKLIMLVSGVAIHDFGTTYKAYRREIIKNIETFGEYHRYIPALAKKMGATIVEIPIKNVVRSGGRSNYGIRRFWPVLLDIIMLKFVVSYLSRPLRMFGSLGLLIFFGGFSISAYLLILFCAGFIPALRERSALLLFSVFLMLVGLQFIGLGISAEINSKIYLKVKDQTIYRIRRIVQQ